MALDLSRICRDITLSNFLSKFSMLFQKRRWHQANKFCKPSVLLGVLTHICWLMFVNLFYLMQVWDTRFCLRTSLTTCRRLIVLLSESILCMAAKKDEHSNVIWSLGAFFLLVKNSRTQLLDKLLTCHILLPQWVGFFLCDGSQMLHTNAEEKTTKSYTQV